MYSSKKSVSLSLLSGALLVGMLLTGCSKEKMDVQPEASSEAARVDPSVVQPQLDTIGSNCVVSGKAPGGYRMAIFTMDGKLVEPWNGIGGDSNRMNDQISSGKFSFYNLPSGKYYILAYKNWTDRYNALRLNKTGVPTSAPLYITLDCGNRPPVTYISNLNPKPGTTSTIDIIKEVDAFDPDGDPITLVSVTGKRAVNQLRVVDNKLVITRNSDKSDTLTYVLSDGKGGVTTRTIYMHAYGRCTDCGGGA